MTKIDIFSGFLGAGKTTLIKKLIKESFAGQKVVLIENEFGEIGIDGGFLKESGIQINELNAGCICCSLVGDFRTALQQVVEQYHPDRIVIEPSGVGKLSDVTRAVEGVAEHLDVQLNSFVTVADVNKVKMYMKNFGEFYDDQISHASCIILSRTQNATEEKIAAAVAMLREKNPTATIVTTAWDALTGEQILKAMSTKDDFKAELIAMAAKANEEHAHEDEEEEHEHHHHHDHDDDHDEHCCCGHHHDHDDDDEDEHEHHHHHHDDDDEYEERRSPLIPILFAVGTAFVIATVFLVMTIVFKNLNVTPEQVGSVAGISSGSTVSVNDSNEYLMPNLIGMSWDEAKSKYSQYMTLVPEQEWSEVTKDQIFDQEYPEGRKVKIGTEVTVKVSMGIRQIEVQDLENLSAAIAESKLQKDGFKVKKTFEESDDIAKDYVIRTEPGAHEMADQGSTVVLVISMGPEDTSVNVPKFVNLPLSVALERAAE